MIPCLWSSLAHSRAPYAASPGAPAAHPRASCARASAGARLRQRAPGWVFGAAGAAGALAPRGLGWGGRRLSGRDGGGGRPGVAPASAGRAGGGAAAGREESGARGEADRLRARLGREEAACPGAALEWRRTEQLRQSRDKALGPGGGLPPRLLAVEALRELASPPLPVPGAEERPCSRSSAR
ncbi:unnamed protein product [Prorocentrum cordatum]|uniref:Uncharacterized protein n=1 Tax=Prorocentrum cordatum TaxID=2364126 RepID=A0ABN9WQB3_9DINO|nr:unnamed protein product [Polarella glacialis]